MSSSPAEQTLVALADYPAALEYANRRCSPRVEELAIGTAHDPIELHVEGASHILMRRVTIPAGGGTGWHYHPGDLLAVVAQGELTHVNAQGETHVYHRGDAFLEPRGADRVHEGRNTGVDEVVLHVTCLNSSTRPLAIPMGGSDASEAPVGPDGDAAFEPHAARG